MVHAFFGVLLCAGYLYVLLCGGPPLLLRICVEMRTGVTF
jgi:hypothetical protein